MIHIRVQFHMNQYQACAWGNLHAEGVIDWPPAPWRILRAIVAGAYNAHLSEKHHSVLKELLHKLASTLPSYTLPPTTYIQHRSPRPQVNLKTARVGPGKNLYSAGLLMSSEHNELYIHWSVVLSEMEELVLSLCLSGLTYMGRKEASATLSLVESAPDANTEIDAQGTRIVAIADPELDADSLWEALNLSAHENYGVNRSAVFPGIRQVTYQIKLPQIQKQETSNRNAPQTVTLTVSGSSQLPFHLSLKLAHRLHQTLVSRCPAKVFTGQEMGEYSKDHNHTIFQCVPDRTGRHVEQIRLYSEGYSSEALAAIASCSHLPGVARGCDISLALADFGSRQEQSDEWVSSTPFFLSRFPAVRRGKPRMLSERYQKDGPEHQALQYLQHLSWLNLKGNPSYHEHEDGLALYLNDVFVVAALCEPFPKFWEWESECRQGKKVGRIGYRVRLKFTAVVTGPIILGYASHYGLGAMAPLREWVGVWARTGQDSDGITVPAS